VAIAAMKSAAPTKAEAVVTEAANAAARVPLLMPTRPSRPKKRSTEKDNETAAKSMTRPSTYRALQAQQFYLQSNGP
jgi:hypothetical protein